MASHALDRGSFDVVVTPSRRDGLINWKELWDYRDLILLLVRRDFIARYKQTVLGPAWAIIQPLVSTLIYAAVFGNLAGLSPSGVPTFLFYLSGQVLWTYFAGCVESSANTFITNAQLMSKVYFPRFVSPIASALTHGLGLLIQSALFLFVYLLYALGGYVPQFDWTLALIPLYLIHLTVLGLGIGSILSALTTKYRDTVFLVSYGVSLLMYITPVVYDLSLVPDSLLPLFLANPVTPLFVQLRSALFGLGETMWIPYFISLAVSVALFLFGWRIFNIVERNFVDTI